MTHKWKRRGAMIAFIVMFYLFLSQGMGSHDILFANVAAVCFLVMCWNQYDEQDPPLAQLVLCAVMISIAVFARVFFLWAPAFKPVSALVILAGLTLGKWNGFLCGSLTALLSDIFFGLGPWTIFQMLAWGIIGACSGFCLEKWFEKPAVRWMMGIGSGIFFSVFMDLYTTFSTDSFELSRFFAFLLTSLPFMFVYCISNIIFLELFYPFFHKKMKRIKQKYEGIGKI